MSAVLLTIGLSVVLGMGAPADSIAQSNGVVVDDFEQDSDGAYPSNWVYVSSDGDVYDVSREMDDDDEWARVQQEDGRSFLRTYAEGTALRITARNGEEFDWSLNEQPWLEWTWRVRSYPEGGNEKEKSANDTAAAIYVTFGTDWIGRPKSIKYTFSSTLGVGATDQQGPLRVMVIDSPNNRGFGDWKTIRRNIPADYRQLFGEDPPNDPISITIWSDSDTIAGQESSADFDEIRVLDL
ncbi:MAG: DUF3047 domain-containing protein [Longimonas sp.]|uniref:DUF3047 domain-containing protein n=1 Tax=Longimonas sp. TaxID=2039626 RepID=UPI0039749E3C